MQREIRLNTFAGRPHVKEGDEFYLLEQAGKGPTFQVYLCYTQEAQLENEHFNVLAACRPELENPRGMNACREFLRGARALPIRWEGGHAQL